MAFVVYLTKYSGDKLPPFYIGSTSEDKVKNGYRGSVLSKKWKHIFKEELKSHPELFDIEILSRHATRIDALTEERKLQLEFDVVKSIFFFNESIAAPNGFFGMDVSGELNPFFNKKHSPELQDQITANIKKAMADPEWKERFSKKQKEVQNLQHNKDRNNKNQKAAQTREDVVEKKRQTMRELYSNEEFRQKHKLACQTRKARTLKSEFRIGKKWIHNPILKQQIYVLKTELDSYFEKGWILGMLKK